MHIVQKVKEAQNESRIYYSFEYFPPKTETGLLNLYDRIERMSTTLKPDFIDITWNAGGESSELTLEVCRTTHNTLNLETCMHLTCTNMPIAKIDNALAEAKAIGLQNILALRGDPPRTSSLSSLPSTNAFNYASDLVKYIRDKYGDYFCIGVAGYPEGHPDSQFEEKSLEMAYLKAKVDAGANFIVSQFFYDCDLFMEWFHKCRECGINVPIIPGMMIIQSYSGFKRMSELCRIKVPAYIEDSLKKIRENDQAVKDYGIQLVIRMCEKLIQRGIPGFHFYTLNLERSTTLILTGLGLLRASNRATLEHHLNDATVAGVSRTNNWDEFTNGRWGDPRSPAYGNLDGYGVNFKYTLKDVQTIWGSPTCAKDLSVLFSGYIDGSVKILPWCHYPLEAETRQIQQRLLLINKAGFWTIDSQPAIDALASADETFGWGPKNGFVFQKAYIEFFVTRALLDVIIEQITTRYPYMTFIAANEKGESVETNQSMDIPNAVTWGVFPGQEIVVPTVIDPQAFLAWKSEAFSIWHRWIDVYPSSDPAKIFLTETAATLYLVNIVNNNFKSKYAIFDLLENCVLK